ncbi:MAG: type II 3-dehydroquinate dehydratase [Pseudomonadota bacterium]
MHKVLILNGPNLNLLGLREPEIYGADTLADVERRLAEMALADVTCHQSNHEGQLVDWIQGSRGTQDGIIINPGAYGHSSIALLDALRAFDGPVAEVHVTNIHAREAYRHHSYISARADAVLCGLGVEGYFAALRWIVGKL